MTDDVETKLTKTEYVPEPIGVLQGFGVIDIQPVLVYECPACVSIVTSIAGHNKLVHPIADRD